MLLFIYIDFFCLLEVSIKEILPAKVFISFTADISKMSKKAVEIESVDLCIKENSENHHTDKLVFFVLL